jgi:hypothetical protein
VSGKFSIASGIFPQHLFFREGLINRLFARHPSESWDPVPLSHGKKRRWIPASAGTTSKIRVSLDAISGVMTILKFRHALASGLPHFLAGWRLGIHVYRDGYSRHRH